MNTLYHNELMLDTPPDALVPVTYTAANDAQAKSTTAPEEKPLPALLPAHLNMLQKESGISDPVIAARGYHSITDHKELTKLGFASRQLQPPGLLLPVHAPDGSQPYAQFRPDSPRHDETGRPVKYETPKGQSVRLDCPPI